MLATLRNAFKNPELRKRILYTIGILVVFRLGSCLILPFVDGRLVANATSVLTDSTSVFGMLNLFSGGAFSSATLFALSISPYITAQIIIQLLTVAIPPLERLAKEGETGRKKLNRITKYVAILMAALQGFGYYTILRWQAYTMPDGTVYQGVLIDAATSGWSQYLAAVVIVACLVAGACSVIWLGDRISEKGIGNGVSMLLFAGILAGLPRNIEVLYETFMQGVRAMQNNEEGTLKIFLVPFILLVFAAMIVFIVIMTKGERRIPVQYAKRVVGRKMYGGQSSYIPIKVNMSSVLPIIFASSLLSLPATIIAFTNTQNAFWQGVAKWLSPASWFYGILFFVLIIGFNYFYVAIQYNPVEIANNIKNNNGAIPGIRPGKPTATFIQKVLSKIVFIGAIFLGIIAVFPIIFNSATGVQVALGGTTIIIVVGVALETMQQLESQIMMRHHKGFLE
ncbi:MAG: preprotein translocase subunit SecY [Oscillospiraceae bacterium]|jgi:preprotein translocase subunit SecY|nr:preprotein translocase subunit SecY [Oscillospiraceae bacterium]